MDELPEGEDMRDLELELFGYVHESGCILAPGSVTFALASRPTSTALHAGWFVSGWRWSGIQQTTARFLNATNLVPV
jgi:hypothetical protein